MLYIAILVPSAFILGILFGTLGYAKISCWSEKIYLNWENNKSKTNIEIVTNNVTVEKIKDTLERCHTNAIGFQTYEPEDDIEYYEEDKLMNNSFKSDRKVGFNVK